MPLSEANLDRVKIINEACWNICSRELQSFQKLTFEISYNKQINQQPHNQIFHQHFPSTNVNIAVKLTNNIIQYQQRTRVIDKLLFKVIYFKK